MYKQIILPVLLSDSRRRLRILFIKAINISVYTNFLIINIKLTIMHCTAKIQDEFGNEYKCLKEAVSKITTITFASHLQKNVTKVRHLCSLHAGRVKSRFNYKIKHCKKQCIITEKKLL